MSEQELESLRKDAARYQWIKKSARLDGDGWVGSFTLRWISAYNITPYAKERGVDHDHSGSFDDAVDAAMRREGANG